MSHTEIPPPTELFSSQELIQRHPRLFTKTRLQWALRNRSDNGLDSTDAIFETRSGKLLIRESSFFLWYLGLTGKNKPRKGKGRKQTEEKEQFTYLTGEHHV